MERIWDFASVEDTSPVCTDLLDGIPDQLRALWDAQRGEGEIEYAMAYVRVFNDIFASQTERGEQKQVWVGQLNRLIKDAIRESGDQTPNAIGTIHTHPTKPSGRVAVPSLGDLRVHTRLAGSRREYTTTAILYDAGDDGVGLVAMQDRGRMDETKRVNQTLRVIEMNHSRATRLNAKGQHRRNALEETENVARFCQTTFQP